MHYNKLVAAEEKSLHYVAHSRLPSEPRINSLLRLGLRALGGGKKIFSCVDTQRSRGVIGLFCLSRIRFREVSLGGGLPGVKKI